MGGGVGSGQRCCWPLNADPLCGKASYSVHSTNSFVQAVNEYCAWAEARPEDSVTEARTALRLLVRLYGDALPLEPPPEVDYELNGTSLSQKEWTTFFKRFGALPFTYYGVACDPHLDAPEEPGVGDLADDLADIYRDLNEGLALERAGHHAEAIHNWWFSFRHHWGNHATSAIHALHTWFEKEAAW